MPPFRSRRNVGKQEVHDRNQGHHQHDLDEHAVAGDGARAAPLAGGFVLEQHGHVLALVAEAHAVLHVLVLH